MEKSQIEQGISRILMNKLSMLDSLSSFLNDLISLNKNCKWELNLCKKLNTIQIKVLV